MSRIFASAAAMLLAFAPLMAQAHGHSGGHLSHSSSHIHSSGGHRSSGSHYSYSSRGSHYRSSWGQHTGHGKKRDHAQRAKFMRHHPCPNTGKTHGACPGYVVDHVQALKHGGADSASNMQWQTTEAAKAKDKWE